MEKAELVVIFLVAAFVAALAQDQDTRITRIRSLTDEEKRIPVRREKTKSVYLVNILPVPYQRSAAAAQQTGNDLQNHQETNDNVRRGNPALFLLQKVDDEENLPDGIYFRPDEDETETPKPAFVKELTDLQSYLFARGPFKSPGRQQ